MSVKVIVTVTIINTLEGVASIILYLVRYIWSFVIDKQNIVVRIEIRSSCITIYRDTKQLAIPIPNKLNI